jgi:hypothetical protein
MSFYLGDKKHATTSMAAAHATASKLTKRIGNLRHKLYRNNFSFS